jgi:hypothetical protein
VGLNLDKFSTAAVDSAPKQQEGEGAELRRNTSALLGGPESPSANAKFCSRILKKKIFNTACFHCPWVNLLFPPKPNFHAKVKLNK